MLGCLTSNDAPEYLKFRGLMFRFLILDLVGVMKFELLRPFSKATEHKV